MGSEDSGYACTSCVGKRDRAIRVVLSAKTITTETDGSKCTDGSVCPARAAMEECSKECGEACQNRAISRGDSLAASLRVRFSGEKGKGLFTTVLIRKGQLVIEYKGKRVQELPAEYDTTYVMKVTDGHIDGNDGGNDSRFINHSCDPNIGTEEWIVDGMYRMALRAIKDIPADTELSMGYDATKRKERFTNCFCNTSVCVNRKVDL